MDWRLRDYSFPFLLALALHAVALAGLINTWHPSRDVVEVIKPKIVNSTLLVLEPKAKPQARPPAPQPTPKPAESAPPKPVEQPKPAPEKAPPKAEPTPKPVEPPKPNLEEVIRQQQEEAERKARLQALANNSFLSALENEAVDIAEDANENASADEAEVAQSYRYGIYQRVVSNWSRPLSARNGMQATLQVELVPTGDIVAVMLLESSGNSAFDRSAEDAVRKARRFEVPKESVVFERYFRRFTLLFRPEDLLR